MWRLKLKFMLMSYNSCCMKNDWMVRLMGNVGGGESTVCAGPESLRDRAGHSPVRRRATCCPQSAPRTDPHPRSSNASHYAHTACTRLYVSRTFVKTNDKNSPLIDLSAPPDYIDKVQPFIPSYRKLISTTSHRERMGFVWFVMFVDAKCM